MLAFLLMMAFATPRTDPSELPVKSESWERVGYGWGGVPAVNYNSDEGFGFGVVANLYRYNGTSAPYSYNLGAQFFTTTKGIHNHRVEIDALRVGGSPLRLTARVQLAVTRAANFCGFGFDVTCDPAVAEQAADALALTEDDRDTFTSRFYKTRSVRPYAFINARYAIDPMPHRVEFFGGLRVEWHQPGDFTSKEPFPDSLYATAFPEGERGFLSVLQAGMMVDNRDNEPAPHRGYWIEGSIRGATPFWGSNWSYFGVNTTLRGYLPLSKDERVVGATRVVLDGFVGHAPVREWANPGGSALYEIYGSLNAGRGIRARRYLGRSRTLLQQEVRWTFVKAKVGRVPVDLTGLAFADVGVVAEEWSDLGAAFAEPLIGTGAGLRIAIDSNFIIRTDIGLSAKEGWAPGMYIDLGNLF